MQQLPKPLITPSCFLSNIQLGLLTVDARAPHLESTAISHSFSQVLKYCFTNCALCSKGTQEKVQPAQSWRLNGHSFICYLEKCKRCFLGLAWRFFHPSESPARRDCHWQTDSGPGERNDQSWEEWSIRKGIISGEKEWSVVKASHQSRNDQCERSDQSGMIRKGMISVKEVISCEGNDQWWREWSISKGVISCERNDQSGKEWSVWKENLTVNHTLQTNYPLLKQ